MIRRIGLDKNKRRTVISPSIYEGGNYVVVDFETSSIEYGSALNLQNNLVLACWYDSATGLWKYKFGQEWEQKELLEDIQKADFIVAQNAKFELGWLDRIGLDLHDVVVWDTMLAEWVILGNRKLPKDLNSMLLRRGLKGKEDVVGGMIKLGIDCNSIPKNLLQTYCMEDVRGTLELFHAQLKEVQERNQLHLVFSRCLLTPVLTDIEKQGINLDHKAVEEEYQAVRQERDKAEQTLQSFGTINWNSKKQLAKFLYEELGFAEATDHQGNPIRTGGGSRSCTSSTISQLKASNKQQREFLAAYLQLAKLNTKLSKSLEFFRVVCNERNGIFYGSFNQGSTGTHRLSSSGKRIVGSDGVEYSAQLQNIPREYKRFVLPREEGWRIVEADGSQLEFRVAADMGHDEVAYKEISNDEDIHSETAKVFLADGTHPDFKGLDIKAARQPAKPQTFKPLYGGKGQHRAEKQYCKFFQDKYKQIYKTQTGWTLDVLKNKELRTPYGLVFYWPDTTMGRSGYVSNTTSIFNYPIQGFATAEIIPIVLVSLWHKLRGHNVRLILTVHDSIVMEVGPDVDMEWLEDLIARAFTEDVYEFLRRVYGYEFWVPLGAEIKAGAFWGDGKGKKMKMFPDKGELIWQ